MTDLRCGVSSCQHHQAELCKKDNIKVSNSGAGNNAQMVEDTCCSSFHERRGDSYTDSAAGAKCETAVTCEVTNCFYNDDCQCKADNIGIGGMNATAAHHTECTTFKER